MTIGLDISQIVYKGTGVARFTEGLVDAILSYDTNNRWVFYFFGLRQQPDPILVDRISESGHTLIRRPIPPTLLAILHNSIHYYTTPITIGNKSSAQLDWFISSDWTEPELRCKKATIVHDLVFKRYPETVHTRIRNTQEERLAWVARESNCIFADSCATAKDLHEQYKIPDTKIIVNYPGINMQLFTPMIRPSSQEILTNLKIPRKFILTVGKLEPRKNIQRLLEAFSHIDADVSLVVAGMEGWGNRPESDDPRIIFPGYVSDDELMVLYKSALCFVYPSLYEGFGYPVIEAMKYGCPVITSDTSSLSEITAKAALLVDPLSVDSIRKALIQMLNDTSLRKDLIAKGKKQASLYTWERYYQTLIRTLSKHTV